MPTVTSVGYPTPAGIEELLESRPSRAFSSAICACARSSCEVKPTTNAANSSLACCMPMVTVAPVWSCWLAAEWSARGVDDCWWDEVDVVGVDGDFPAGVMRVVMGLAEKNAVAWWVARSPLHPAAPACGR
jgi:hypothetical protein